MPGGAGPAAPPGSSGPGFAGVVSPVGVGGFDVSLNADMTANDIAGDFGGLSLALDWAVPTALVTMPGLLLLLVIGMQLGGGLAWLPVARRTLGGFGLRRRRQA